MTDPIIFISHFRLKEGAYDDYAALQHQVAAQLDADRPRTLAFLSYADEERTRISIVHAFADAESMDIHVEGAVERSRAAYQYLAPAGWEIYGMPSAAVLQMLGDAAAVADVTLTVVPAFEAGFLRMGAA
ncbi:MAG: hypothetical protein H0U86_03655 [Chloroflexi bacterium]|nr:hypothetical protein [Chloroflexota bacterium]